MQLRSAAQRTTCSINPWARASTPRCGTARGGQNCGRQNLCRPSADKLERSRGPKQPGHDRSAFQKMDVLGSGEDKSTGPHIVKRPSRAGGFALVESEC